jgi:hypothetical protein
VQRPNSGSRMVDSVITNTLLPAFSRQILNKAICGVEFSEAWVEVKDGVFWYFVS